MNSSVIIEAVGYLGSALVLVSFLMVSVVKLRIVNTIGSIIFTIYAFIIHSYPTAIMNLCLVMINIYYLIKMSNTKENTREYELVKVSPDDSMFKYIVDRQKEDIQKCFPGISLDFSGADMIYVICYKGAPAGLFAGVFSKSDVIDIKLDYSLQEYRDFSMGSFIFSRLARDGIRTLTFSGPDEHHKEYLSKYNFVKQGDSYLKVI